MRSIITELVGRCVYSPEYQNQNQIKIKSKSLFTMKLHRVTVIISN